MDFMLNISHDNEQQPKEVKKSWSPKKERERADGNGVSFTFDSKAKVKAIVARKRKVVDTNTNVSNNKSINEKLPRPFNSLDKPSTISKKIHAVGNELPKNVDKSSSLQPEPQISLNVSSEPACIVSRIFNPDMQRRIERLKSKSEVAPQTSSYLRFPERDRERNAGRGRMMFKKIEETPVLGQRLVKPIYEKVFSGAHLDTVGLHSHLVKTLKDLLNISELTTVQQRAIPNILQGRDILIRSQTGSGKTLAYGLPIVHKLQEIRPKLTRNCGIHALVVVPTRELAIQSYELFIKILKPYTWLVPGYLSGGEKRKSEKARLRKGINILIGTPGRLVDHLINTSSLSLEKVQWLVLDEADRLFELGYEKDVSKIVGALKGVAVKSEIPPQGFNDKQSIANKPFHIKKFANEDDSNEEEEEEDENKGKDEHYENKTEEQIKILPNVQSILLSATLSSSVEKLAGLTLTNPLFIDTADLNQSESASVPTMMDEDQNMSLVIPSTVSLCYILVPPKLRLVLLSGLIARECASKKNKVLVFMATQDLVDFHYDLMVECLTRKVLDNDDDNDEDDDDDDVTTDGILVGVRFFKLHGSMTQVERSNVFKEFWHAKSGVLLTTDVAARGLDVPKVDLVILYTPPQLLSDFVHRVGRTARAGQTGRAIVILCPHESEYVRLLENKRIRLSQSELQPVLDVLCTADQEAHSSQEAASNLQHKFESLIDEDKEMHDKASKAFSSWVRYYSAFPKDVKHIFNVRTAHMGHFAKSFGLKETPKNLVHKHVNVKPEAPINRLTYRNRDDNKKGKKRSYEGKPLQKLSNKFNKKTICMSVSEYDSGMPLKKKKK